MTKIRKKTQESFYDVIEGLVKLLVKYLEICLTNKICDLGIVAVAVALARA